MDDKNRAGLRKNAGNLELDKMTDRLAKDVFDRWPQSFFVNEKKWLRLRSPSDKSMPYLYVPGSRKHSVMPDGLYAHFGLDDKDLKTQADKSLEIEFVDVIAIEACNSFSNFYDKRSRYVSENRLGLYCQERWLQSNKIHIGNNDCEVQNIPVRFQSVLFILKSNILSDIQAHLHPWSNEFFLSWGKRKEAAESFLSIVGRMIPEAHFIEAKCDLVIDTRT